MAWTLAQKLRIKDGMSILTINAPSDGISLLRNVAEGLRVSPTAKDYQQIHWFVKNQAEMEKELGKVLKLLKEGIICWIYYPKGKSKMQTDLTRDQGWERLLKHDELQWLNLISFDDVWSAFAMRLQTAKDQKKEMTASKRAIFDYIDPVAKTVQLPSDLEKLLKKSKKAAIFFDNLSFTNKKEYVDWVVSAKRPETRKERMKGTISKLEKNWKNPRNL